MHVSDADSATVDATIASSLEGLDDATNYRNWIIDLARPYLGESILEIGAGHGTFTEGFAAVGSVTAVEPGTHGGSVLTARFADDPRVVTLVGVAADVEADGFDSAVMINVFEHIDDEAGVLSDIRSRLAPDGHLVIWVPAFMLLYSRFDRRLGHHRRYRRRPLEALMVANGFDVVESRHVNLPGWFSWLFLVRILRQEPTDARTIRVFDRWIVPPVRWLEQRITMPFGQSIFLVARPSSTGTPTT